MNFWAWSLVWKKYIKITELGERNLKIWLYLSKRHCWGKLCTCTAWGWWITKGRAVPWHAAWREFRACRWWSRRAKTQHTLSLQRRRLCWCWNLLTVQFFCRWRGLDVSKKKKKKKQVLCKTFQCSQKACPLILVGEKPYLCSSDQRGGVELELHRWWQETLCI